MLVLNTEILRGWGAGKGCTLKYLSKYMLGSVLKKWLGLLTFPKQDWVLSNLLMMVFGLKVS